MPSRLGDCHPVSSLAWGFTSQGVSINEDGLQLTPTLTLILTLTLTLL